MFLYAFRNCSSLATIRFQLHSFSSSSFFCCFVSVKSLRLCISTWFLTFIMKLPVALVLLAAVLPSTTAFHLGSGHQRFDDIERRNDKSSTSLSKRTSCENSASDRACWGDYSINDDWYTTIPDTGVTREVCTPKDLKPAIANAIVVLVGSTEYHSRPWCLYTLLCYTLLSTNYSSRATKDTQWTSSMKSVLIYDLDEADNHLSGSIPGPTISADWGDNVIVHVTNNVCILDLGSQAKPDFQSCKTMGRLSICMVSDNRTTPNTTEFQVCLALSKSINIIIKLLSRRNSMSNCTRSDIHIQIP